MRRMEPIVADPRQALPSLPAPTLEQLVQSYGGVLLAVDGSRSVRVANRDPRLAVRPGDLRIQSGSVQPGDIFAALPGLRADGARFAPDAAARGASAVLVSPVRSADRLAARFAVRGKASPGGAQALLWLHPRPREVASRVAAEIHGQPSAHIDVLGVTGTNGKTSVCHIAAQLLEAAGRVPAILGTAGHVLRGAQGPLHFSAANTTPDATDVQRLLARHRSGGGDSAVMEVSSHGLVHGRIDGVGLRVGAFTNLTREHLDFHGTMEAYLAAKARLWDHVEPGGVAVVFGTSDASRLMRAAAQARGLRVLAVLAGLDDALAASDADERLVATALRRERLGIRFDLTGLGLDRTNLLLPLVGPHNLENALVAAAIARSLNLPADAICAALGAVRAAPGRLEPVDLPNSLAGGFEVLVDYAHSPDALERVLAALREGGPSGRGGAGRLICVFGCGGDRDRGKRAPMGRAAGRLADLSIVTSDNPRSEDPGAIADEVVRGVDLEGGRRLIELDRGDAIRRAIEMARPGDVVLIAGKGHENTQVTRAGARPFDDRVVAAEALAERARLEGGRPRAGHTGVQA